MTFNQIIQDPRVTKQNDKPINSHGDYVLYWMHSSQRINNNCALNTAFKMGNTLHQPVVIYFGLDSNFPEANLRHFKFMIEGLTQVAQEASKQSIPFVISLDTPYLGVLKMCYDYPPSSVVTDENHLSYAKEWRKKVALELPCLFISVDSNVVVPSKLFEKEEYSAYTFRKKIHGLLPSFLKPEDKVDGNYQKMLNPIFWQKHVQSPDNLLSNLSIADQVQPVTVFKGGISEALDKINHFLTTNIDSYEQLSNKPEKDKTSRLSPYLHFGQISVRQLAWEVKNTEGISLDSKNSFLEQLIVRRELAINYIYHNPKYYSLTGCHPWAQETLNKHQSDVRPIVYTYNQLESAATHDPLWNAAQVQMITEGWMHGYLRMYWAKKILEWTKTPTEAFNFALQLNNKYFLDGRDPNGYTGIAWAIGGKHDRPWGPERDVFGKVRYMSFPSTSRKFKSKVYIARYGEGDLNG